MGCSGSRLAGVVAEEAAPARILPLLRQRLEEMKKRNYIGVWKGTPTQSKKGLLRHSSIDRMGNDGSMRSAKVAPAPIPEEEKEVIYEEKVTKEKAEEEEEKEKDERQEKVVEVIVEEKKKITEGKKEERHDCHDHEHDHNQKQQSEDVREIKDRENEDDDDEEEEEDGGGRISNFDERMIIWPGSPSFRVYCVDVSDDDDDQGEGEEEMKKLQKEDDGVMDKTKEDLITTNKTHEKKEKKQWRFTTAIRRAMPGKYLYNVASRVYYQGGCMGTHHSRLVQEKSIEGSMERKIDG